MLELKIPKTQSLSERVQRLLYYKEIYFGWAGLVRQRDLRPTIDHLKLIIKHQENQIKKKNLEQVIFGLECRIKNLPMLRQILPEHLVFIHDEQVTSRPRGFVGFFYQMANCLTMGWLEKFRIRQKVSQKPYQSPPEEEQRQLINEKTTTKSFKLEPKKVKDQTNGGESQGTTQ